MTTKDFTANVISATKVVPDGNFKDSKASGIWDINEALDLIKGGNWPNVANINPAAFVDALFSTHLYTGIDDTQTITNGIDLSGKGGLVWQKWRNASGDHWWIDTERGVQKSISSNNNEAEQDKGSNSLTAFNSNGFTVGSYFGTNDMASWTFRKQPKFFDIQTYTGNRQDTNSYQDITHNLGSTPGMIIVKETSSADDWMVYHRSANSADGIVLKLNSTDAASDFGNVIFDVSEVNSSSFRVGNMNNVNANGVSYVAYLFAHHDDDGGFGAAGDQDIIKCGSYTGNGSNTGPVVDLGFEPQWVMIKESSSTGDWAILDNMRGIGSGGAGATDDNGLDANKSNAEYAAVARIDLTSTGFKVTGTSSDVNTNSETYIYMAIRRGGMQTPSAASSVFGLQDYTSGGDGPVTGIVTDFSIIRDRDADAANYAATRLLGNSYLTPMLNSAEVSSAGAIHDRMDGAWSTSFAGYMIWGWQRARGYFDVVAYSGTGSARTVTHNLGVAPEMMWIKRRDSTGSWNVYHKGLNGGTNPEQHVIYLEANEASNSGGSAVFNNTAPTSSVFTVNTNSGVNNSSGTYTAYLFATVAGVSKVGSFTQSGATNVACGFTGDTPALIILKRTDSTGNWYILDSVRGIVAGNDPHTYINESNPEISNVDLVDPYSGGFATTSSLANGDYIFYAIASIA